MELWGQCQVSLEPSGRGFLSTSQAVIQYLPYLRRYARALSGSQASGDAYVAAALEALVRDPQSARYRLLNPDRSVSTLHEDLEFGRVERKIRLAAM